jgi:hypothetical protein
MTDQLPPRFARDASRRLDELFPVIRQPEKDWIVMWLRLSKDFNVFPVSIRGNTYYSRQELEGRLSELNELR